MLGAPVEVMLHRQSLVFKLHRNIRLGSLQFPHQPMTLTTRWLQALLLERNILIVCYHEGDNGPLVTL